MFNSAGNLKMDLLHNFFLESGARMGKVRVYEATQNPVAREMVGYLIVRGGVHQEGYAKAFSDLSGVDITKLLPVPEISSTRFPHAKKFMDKGPAPHPVPLQPRRLQGARHDLERPPGGDRRAARGPGSQPGAPDLRPRRERQGHRQEALGRNRPGHRNAGAGAVVTSAVSAPFLGPSEREERDV